MPVNAEIASKIEGKRRNGPARFLSLGNRRVRAKLLVSCLSVGMLRKGKQRGMGVKHDASVSKEVLKQSATGSYSDRESRN